MNEKTNLRHPILLFISYMAISGVILTCWAVISETERVLYYRQEGIPVYAWTNLQKLADGSAPSPFVYRRLLADSARLLSSSIGENTWNLFLATATGDTTLLRKFFNRLHWPPQAYPLLLSGYFLIGLSILGFMYSCRSFTLSQYRTPPFYADIIGAFFGISLLGGLGTGFPGYPYDIPNAFVFTLTLNGIVQHKRWWMIFAFCAAVYSKETACLLIVAYIVVNRRWKDIKFWMMVCCLTLIYLSIQFWIRQHYVSPPANTFWYPSRNLVFFIKSSVYHMWMWIICLIIIIRIIKMWYRIPPDLRWLTTLIVIIVSAAFFNGWIEERRQYYEILPIIGLITIQWAMEMGHHEQKFTPIL